MGTVTPVGQDPPDFQIDHDGRRIAVEMTGYHQDAGPKGSKQGEQEALEGRVTAEAQALFEVAHPGVHVLVEPSFMHGSIKRRDLHLYADRLARAVAALVLPMPTEPLVTVSAGWAELEPFELDNVLAFLEVDRARASTRSQWGFGGAGRMSTDVAHLLSRIREKEGDLPRYRASCSECWLIVYSTGSPSTYFDFEVLRQRMWKSAFDAVVVLDGFSGRSVIVA